ncbi:hypothetical protein DL93DRAFT_2167271 [Clavulina sp. PMI_390]|nr:hypothetical protein DL93DRAFT_2167271 [Clavulina sp. PMI_390]
MTLDAKPLAGAMACLESFSSIVIDARSMPNMASNPLDRSAARQQLNMALSQADEAILTVRSLERKLRKILSSLKIWRSRAVNLDAPASALPTELLQLVFEYVLVDDSSPLIRLTLSHVCSVWRAASIGFTKMWTSITIANPSNIPLLAAFSERAGSLPIDLHVTDPNIWGDRMDGYIQRFLLNRISQITHHTRSPRVEPSVAMINPSQLNSLSIRGIGQHFTIPYNISLLRRLKLSHLELTASSTALVLPYLDFLHIGSTTLRSLSRLLSNIDSPALQHVKLTGIILGSEAEGMAFSPEVNLGGLQKLELFQCQVDVLRTITGHLIAPALSFIYIELSTSHPFAHQVTLDFRTILFDAFSLRFKELEKISVRISWVFALPLLGAVLDTHQVETHLPKLKFISFYLLDPPPRGHFTLAITRRIQDLVRQRAPPNAPAHISQIESLKLARPLIMDSEAWFLENVPRFWVV